MNALFNKLMTMRSDALGISASMVCLLHCMAIPVAAAFAPLFLAGVLEAPWFHLMLILLVGPTAGWALWRGYCDHGHFPVIAAGLVGLALVAFGSLVPLIEELDIRVELGSMATGSLILVATHLRNYHLRLQTGHKDHCSDHCNHKH